MALFGTRIQVDQYYYTLVGLNFVLFNTIYWLSGPLLRIFTSTYSHLTELQQLSWCNRVPSTIHALISSTLAAYALLYDEDIAYDKLRGYSHDVLVICCICLGYMIHDLMVLLIYYKKIGEATYLIHHLLSILPFWFVLSEQLYAHMAIIRIFAEISTPCVNLRVFLHDSGMKWGRLYFYNGCAMLATFFIGRMIPMPICYYLLWKIQETPFTTPHLLVILPIGFGLDYLNCVWFVKMVRGSIKIIQRRASSSTSNQNSSTTPSAKTSGSSERSRNGTSQSGTSGNTDKESSHNTSRKASQDSSQGSTTATDSKDD